MRNIDPLLIVSTVLLKITALALAAAIIATVIGQYYAHAGQDTVFRDSRGNVEGTAQRSGNQTTFRDSRGNVTGRAVTDSGGQTRFFGARGNSVGTSSRR